jgi:F-type H+-transporting ATPase subunit a
MVRILKQKRQIFRTVLFFLFIAGISFVFAAFQPVKQKHDTHQEKTQQHHEESWEDEVAEQEYNAGESIIEHIIDSHEWHIATYGHTHISIPLPIILYHDGRLFAFWSSKFHHGHETYKGFKLETDGENKGKISADDSFKYLNKEIEVNGSHEAKLPLDLSITKTVAAMLVSIFLLCWIFISIAGSYKRRKGEAPKGLQSMLEPLIVFVRDDIAKAAIGEKKYQKYLPFLLTIFFFIFFNNLMGLIPIFPGGANVTGNIAVTGVLALFTFFITLFSSNKNYWRHIFNTPGVPIWLKLPIPLMPIVELMGVVTKPFVLMVRLFANITAGHIIILGFISLIFIFGNLNPAIGYGASLVSVPFSIFMGLLELLVAFIQAYVFTLLSALYFGMAIEEEH